MTVPITKYFFFVEKPDTLFKTKWRLLSSLKAYIAQKHIDYVNHLIWQAKASKHGLSRDVNNFGIFLANFERYNDEVIYKMPMDKDEEQERIYGNTLIQIAQNLGYNTEE